MLDNVFSLPSPLPGRDSILLYGDPRAEAAAATPNAGSLFSGSGRARKDRDRLEYFWGGVSAPYYAATCIEDQRDKESGNSAGQVASHPLLRGKPYDETSTAI